MKDQFDVSWQIVPDNIDEVLFKGPKDEARRASETLLKMKKIDISVLEKARLEK